MEKWEKKLRKKTLKKWGSTNINEQMKQYDPEWYEENDQKKKENRRREKERRENGVHIYMHKEY